MKSGMPDRCGEPCWVSARECGDWYPSSPGSVGQYATGVRTVTPNPDSCAGYALVVAPSSLDGVRRYAASVYTISLDPDPYAGCALVLTLSSLDDVCSTSGLRARSLKPQKLLLEELILTCELEKNQ
jgi:hypothetical protein